MKKTYIKSVAATLITLCSTACNSYNEPKTDGEWKAFCEAPNSEARIKAISDETKRQKAAGVCLHAPWQKFEPSKPRTW